MASKATKVESYEAFLNERLKTDLKKVMDLRDNVNSEIAEYMQLRNVIERIKESDTAKGDTLRTMVDLGANFYCQARVSNPDTIFVCLGYGFYVELSLDEALSFIEKRVALLTSRFQELTKDVSQISARVRIVVEGLRELQFGPSKPEESPYFDV